MVRSPSYVILSLAHSTIARPASTSTIAIHFGAIHSSIGQRGGTLSGGHVFATCDAGTFDGIRLDDSGRVWAAAHDGLHCFDPDGTLLGKLKVPEIVSNLTFAGPKRNDLHITASSSVYALRVNFTGVRYRR